MSKPIAKITQEISPQTTSTTQAIQTQYQELQSQLQTINDFLAGEESPHIAQQTLTLRTQQTQLQQKIATLTAELTVVGNKIPTLANGKHKELLEAISQQRWYYFKDKTYVLYDSHTGYLWPNLEYFQMPTFAAGMAKDLSLSGLGTGKWSANNTLNLINTIYGSYPCKAKINVLLSTDTIGRGQGHVNAFYPQNKTSHTPTFDNAYILPHCPLYANPDIAPHITNFTPLEKAQKVLDLFLEQGWQPIFDNVDHYAIYQQLQQRPQLLKAISDLEPALALAIENEKNQQQSLSGTFNHQTDLKTYNLSAIDASSLQYAHALQQWTSNLLNKLDDFSQQHSNLIKTATTLHQRLHSDTDINENVGDDLGMLVARDEYLQNALNFGLDSVRSKLLNAHQHGQQLQQQLNISALSPNLLSDLAAIQHAPRPSFAFIAEYTANIVVAQIRQLEWLQTHQQALTKLVDTHHTWLNAFDTFTSKDHSDFLQAAKREHIEQNLAQDWYNEWRQQRSTLEAQVLPLCQLALSHQCPLDTANAVLDILQTYKLAIDTFYEKERIAIHQKFDFVANGAQQEQYETRLQLFKLSSQFTEQLEALLFALPQVAVRINLLRWSEAMTQQHFSGISQQLDGLLATTQHSDIVQTISQELRQLQQRTLETFVQDAQHFAQARAERDKDFNGLVYRMRKELQKAV